MIERGIKTKLRAAVSVMLCAAVLACALLPFAPKLTVPTLAADATLSDANVKQMKEEIKELEKKQQNYLNDLANTRSKKATELEYKSYLDAYLASVDRKIDINKELLANYEKEIEDKKLEIEDKKLEIDRQYALCLERLSYSYEEGSAGYLELILDSESLTDFLSRLEHVTNILEYDKKLLADLEESKAQLENDRDTLEGLLVEQRGIIAELDNDRIDYEQKAQESLEYIETLNETENEKLTLYYRAKSESEKLDKELEEYIRELQARQAKAYVGGEFNWPLDPSFKRLSSVFGPRTYNGVYENHGALDIPAPSGTPIYASNAGTVLKAEYHYSYGNYVLLDHGGGRSTLYAHCSALLVSAGQDVVQGQQIGKVGTTGYSGGNHLHFEFRINGVRDNPVNYVVMPSGWYVG